MDLWRLHFFLPYLEQKKPGEGCMYVSQILKFKRPVYIGDTVVASVEVTSIDLEKRRVFFKTECRVKNQIVTDGEAELAFKRSIDALFNRRA